MATVSPFSTKQSRPVSYTHLCDRLTVLGFDSFIIDDQQDFERFLEENHQYWDYVDEDLEQKMQGLSQIRLYLEDSAAAPEQISTCLLYTSRCV